eukprot:1084536-Pyramimonas_sp.AAC.1
MCIRDRRWWRRRRRWRWCLLVVRSACVAVAIVALLELPEQRRRQRAHDRLKRGREQGRVRTDLQLDLGPGRLPAVGEAAPGGPDTRSLRARQGGCGFTPPGGTLRTRQEGGALRRRRRR